jgi:hypothetical protein
VDGHRDFSDGQQRWYGDEDAPWEGRVANGRPGEGYGMDPRGVDGPPSQRRPDEPGFGARYADAGPRRGAADDTFDGFAPARQPPDPMRVDLNLTPSPPGPAAYPIVPPPPADLSATAERARALDAPTGPISAVGPRPGEAVPQDAPRFHAEPIDRTALRRPPAPAAPVRDGVYRTRRPGVALLLGAAAAVFEVLALRVLLDGAFGGPLSPPGVIAGLLLMVALPMFAMGLYALVTGAGRVPDQSAGAVWLRPPVAYLTIGLVLFVAAGLAAG